eukprot:GHVL01004539.1.p3 GENE.GHVL01004539.1~~GHVL01004539.1.p3  ORF type:complete len:240 (-),score=38.05 GHVL01004539.1:1286-2005(-)
MKKIDLSWRKEVAKMPAAERHNVFLSWLAKYQNKSASCDEITLKSFVKTDCDILHENHRFLRTDKDDDGTWESNLAKKYYAKLYKEYVICDILKYRTGKIGFRWRTEREVICERKALKSYEVQFSYSEANENKAALVKVRLCVDCAYKLNYQALKRQIKRRRKDLKRSKKNQKLEGECMDLKLEAVIKNEPESQSESDDEKLGAETLRKLEEMAWKGPRKDDIRSRADEFDDYFQGMFS